MPTWKKVIVSGSTANLANIQVDGLTSGQVVIGGGTAGNLTTTAINGSGNIVATTGASGLVHSGSFSGSFAGTVTGNLVGTATTASFVTSSNVFGPYGGNSVLSSSYAVTAAFALSAAGAATPFSLSNSTGITAFSFNGGSNQTVAVSGASTLGTNSIARWTGTAFTGSSLTDNGTTITGISSIQLTGLSSSLSGSFSGSHFGPLTGTASYASTAGQNQGTLTLGNGLTGTSYNGSANVTAAVGAGALISVGTGITAVATSSLVNNQIPKYSNNTLSGSNISDNGVLVSISANATSGLSVGAGGINVTGNSTFINSVNVQGDLTVAGTASFQNTQNLIIGDRFAMFASGATSLTDGGIIIASSTGAGGISGSAFFLESNNTGLYGRFAVQYNVQASASTITADEYAVTVKQSAANPADATPPTWGGSTNGQGNMWVNTTSGEIYIWSGP